MVAIIKYKRVILMSLIIISLLFGMYLYSKLDENILTQNIDAIKYFNYKEILFHILILSISFILSFIGVGTIILILYLFFEGITIGFMTLFFLSIYKASGIISFIFYILIFKLILIFLIIILLSKYIKIFKNILIKIKGNNIDITKTIINSIAIIFTILFYDCFLLIFGTKLLNIFLF